MENLYQTNSTDFCNIDRIERGSQDVTDILHQTHSMDITDISPTEKLSDSNGLQDVTSQDVTEHSHETHFKDVTGTSPIESLADLNTLQDVTPVPDRDSQDVTNDTDQSFLKDVTDNGFLLSQHYAQSRLESRLDQSAGWNSSIEPVINIVLEYEAEPIMKIPIPDIATDNTDNTVSISSRAIANSSYNDII